MQGAQAIWIEPNYGIYKFTEAREMVSRIFKDLVQGGYVSVEPDRIVIHRKPPARW